MQHTLTNKIKTRNALNTGVHQALYDFRLLLHNMSLQPTSIAELVPLHSSAEGHHEASGEDAGDV